VYQKSRRLRLAPVCVVAFSSILGACSQSVEALDSVTTSSLRAKPMAYSMKDKECLTRAMFFESHRSSREGMVAVGTVVMNRLDSGKYADTVCGVVGQKNQFAPGVLSRKMNSKALPDVQAAAEAVLKGERHPAVKKAQFFHQAGLKFPYKNMHYVLEAGGNAFYEKRSRRSQQIAEAEKPAETVATDTTMMSYSVEPQAADAIGAMLANQTRPLAAE
jgi:spore germination cell wall hydrolase CwlJ-like protein